MLRPLKRWTILSTILTCDVQAAIWQATPELTVLGFAAEGEQNPAAVWATGAIMIAIVRSQVCDGSIGSFFCGKCVPLRGSSLLFLSCMCAEVRFPIKPTYVENGAVQT
jgi:hypothetical protein